jgi:hypothetical protein
VCRIELVAKLVCSVPKLETLLGYSLPFDNVRYIYLSRTADLLVGGELSQGTILLKPVTSMIGLCQEGKGSPDALRRSAGTNLSDSSPRVDLSAVVPLLDRTELS